MRRPDFSKIDDEIERIMNMSDDELRQELAKEGLSWDELLADSKKHFNSLFDKPRLP